MTKDEVELNERTGRNKTAAITSNAYEMIKMTVVVPRRVRHFPSRLYGVALILCLSLGIISPFTPIAKSAARAITRRQVVAGLENSTAERTAIDEQALKELNSCQSGTRARKLLEQALGGDERQPLYGSISIPPGASDRGLSDGDLAIQTKIRNTKYSIMELIELNGDKDADRASLALVLGTVGSTASALLANQYLPGPEIVRFVVVWLLSFAPLAFVGYGIATPEKLQALLVSVQRNVFPTYRKRMIQHEAAHFLMGHLLGIPIKGYATNAVKSAVEFYPLNDPELGRDRVQALGFDRSSRSTSNDGHASSRATSADAAFFSKEGRGADALARQLVFRNAKNYTANPFLQIPSQNEPSNAWPYRGFDEATLDKLTVVSVAGVCAEILAFGNAEGGYADISQLRQLFNSAEEELDERAMENRIRFALGYTMSQLRRHLGALDALAEVMESGGSIADCVLAIETCLNVSGQDGVIGDYERRRKEKFLEDGISILERAMLGGGKNADVMEDRLVEGPGGGYRKQRFQLNGDDPLYAAVGVAVVFFLWASSGGLSLH